MILKFDNFLKVVFNKIFNKYGVVMETIIGGVFVIELNVVIAITNM